MGRLGLELGRIRLADKLRVYQWAPQIASAEASLNRKPMATLRGNAPNDLQKAIKSADPEERVIEYQQLETMADNIAINRKEDTKMNKALEATTAFRAPITAEKGQKGMIATRNRPGEAKFGGKVRGLKDAKVEFGRAVDSKTNESFPAKLVVAVPAGSDEIPDEAIKQGRPEWRIRQNREIFQPFLMHVVDFIKKGENGIRSSGKLKNFLDKLKPELNWGLAVKTAFGAPKSPIREFLDTFEEQFEWDKGLTMIKVRPSARPSRRIRGKQPMPPQIPTKSVLNERKLRGKQPIPERRSEWRGVGVRSTKSLGQFASKVSRTRT
jgi:hypothetical protein